MIRKLVAEAGMGSKDFDASADHSRLMFRPHLKQSGFGHPHFSAKESQIFTMAIFI